MNKRMDAIGCCSGWLAALVVFLLTACSDDAGVSVGRKPVVEFQSTVSGPTTLPANCRERVSESFPQLAMDPIDPRRISALYFQDGTLAAVGASSGDAGRSWARAPVSDASHCAGGPEERQVLVNPLFAQGPDGRVYYGNSFGKVVAHTATDAAGGWSAGKSPGKESNEDGSENLNLLPDTVIPSRVQAVWTHMDYPAPPPFPVFTSTELRTAVSLDGATSFQAPQLAARSPLGHFIINSRLARTSDGAMLVCYDSVPALLLANAFTGARTSFEVRCTRSLDGVIWTEPVRAGVSQFLPLADLEGREPDGARPGEIALSAKFDLATGPDGVAILVHADLDDAGRGLIRMAKSTDNGISWTDSLPVIERSAPLFMPAAAIAQDGTLGLFWYDWTQDQPGDAGLSTTAWFAASYDGGEHWSEVPLSGPFDLRAAYDPDLRYDGGALGTYQDLAAGAGGFGAVFTVGPPLAVDGRTDVVFTSVR